MGTERQGVHQTDASTGSSEPSVSNDAVASHQIDPLVTVCDSCLRACCWQGEFYCDDYRSAGTIKKPISELRALALEHPDYWREGR